MVNNESIQKATAILRNVKIQFFLFNNKLLIPKLSNVILKPRDKSFLNFVRHFDVIICGSFALKLYGLLNRRHKDYDVIVTEEQLSEISENNIITKDIRVYKKDFSKNVNCVGRIEKLNICLFVAENKTYELCDDLKVDKLINIIKLKFIELNRRKDIKDMKTLKNNLFNTLQNTEI